jgi:hypothetical protein
MSSSLHVRQVIYPLSQATKVRECYKIWVLWYLLAVLAYQSTSRHCDNIPANPSWINDIPLQSHNVILAFHIIIYCRISIILLVFGLVTPRISHAPRVLLFESCQNHFSVRVKYHNFHFTGLLRPKT